MFEKEMKLVMDGATPSEAYNAYSSQRKWPVGLNGGRNAAAVCEALAKVKKDSFWKAILELEEKFI